MTAIWVWVLLLIIRILVGVADLDGGNVSYSMTVSIHLGTYWREEGGKDRGGREERGRKGGREEGGRKGGREEGAMEEGREGGRK